MLTPLVVLYFMSWFVTNGGFRLENTMKDCWFKQPLPERFPPHIHTDTLYFPTTSSIRKQTTFCDTTTGFPAKEHLRKEHRNSILMMRHYLDLGTASDWSCHLWNLLLNQSEALPQTWVVMSHQYGISALISQTSFHGEAVTGVSECHLFSQATFPVQGGNPLFGLTEDVSLNRMWYLRSFVLNGIQFHF